MREIPLTQGQVALVDDADYELVSQYRWQALWQESANTWYASCVIGYPRDSRTTIRMHRLIMGVSDSRLVDHWDHVGTHNWRANLRVCSASQNAMNIRKRAGCSSIYKGVYWDTLKRNWHARIRRDYVYINLGRFHSETDAAKAYNEAAIEMFGSFALLNEIAS